VREALDVLQSRGIAADFMRIRAFPFPESVEQFLNDHEFNFIVEQNRDAQMKSLLLLETGVAKDKLRSICVYGGFPLSARRVTDRITSQLGELTERAVHS